MRAHSELGEFYYLNNEKEKAQKFWSSSITKFKSNRSFIRIMVSMYGKYGLDNELEQTLKVGKNQFSMGRVLENNKCVLRWKWGSNVAVKSQIVVITFSNSVV